LRFCVIISDALRYEIAEELLGRIRSLDRYEAGIEPMFGSLPSYTQLGMASLLPNGELQIADNDTATVLVNGQSSQGVREPQEDPDDWTGRRSDHGPEGRRADEHGGSGARARPRP
jgi:hypothetical protein